MDMMNKEIQSGDRIFARLTMGGKVIMEFMMNRVNSMAELMGEVRQMTNGLRGLARLQVRNQSRGWARTSNVMFYGTGNSSANNNIFGRVSAQPAYASATSAPASAHMALPWETH